MLVDRRGFGPSGFHTRDPARLTRVEQMSRVLDNFEFEKGSFHHFPEKQDLCCQPHINQPGGFFWRLFLQKAFWVPSQPGFTQNCSTCLLRCHLLPCLAICSSNQRIRARIREIASRACGARASRAAGASFWMAEEETKTQSEGSTEVPEARGILWVFFFAGKKREKCCRWFPSWHPDF